VARKRGNSADSRADLLNAAWQLMLEQGASALSVEAIVGRAGLSKGTFFHFFPTKQALLDSLCDRIADEAWRDVGPVFDRTDLSPLERLDEYLRVSRAWRLERSRAIGVLWRELGQEDSAILMNKVRALTVDRLTPLLADIIAEGKRLGQLHVDDEVVVARLLLEWLHASVEGTMRLLAERAGADPIDLALRRANATLATTERVLGAPEGSLHRVSRSDVELVAGNMPRDQLRVPR